MRTLSERLEFIKRVFDQYDLARNEKNCAVKCQFCKKNSNKKKFAIKLDDMKCHCWVCGYASHSLLAPLKSKFPQFVNEYVEKFYFGDKKTALQNIDNSTTVQLPRDFKLLAMYADSNNPQHLASINYLKRRSITIEDMWLWKFGISDDPRWQNRIIIPSFDCDGNLNHFVARAIVKNKYPKYDMPDIHRNSIIFNELYVDWHKPLVLCEGVFDAINCGTNVVPLLGSDLNEQSLLFDEIIVHKTPIILALDEDMWYTKTPKLARLLSTYDVDVSIAKIVNDPGTMSKCDVDVAFKNAKKMSWKELMYTKLNKASTVSLLL